MHLGGRHGFTLIEMLMVTAVIGVVAAISIPGLTRAKISANEASAIGSLRTVVSGQQAFSAACGRGQFSMSLQNLGTPALGGPGFISPDLSMAAPVVKSGYTFVLASLKASTVVSCNGGVTALGYHATADPLVGRGRRCFGTNGNATIYESLGTLAGIMPDDQPPPAPAKPVDW